MKSPSELYAEASSDDYTCSLNRPGFSCFLYFGIKISKNNETGEIKIYKTHKDDYDELSKSEYDYFFIHGWTIGVYELVYNMNSEKIKKANERLKLMADCSRNEKAIRELTSKRDNRIEQQVVIIRRSCHYLNTHEKVKEEII